MSDKDVADFRIELSRELGAITERLRSIDEHLTESKSTASTMWRRIDQNTQEIINMKARLAVISALVSFVVANGRQIIDFILNVKG